MIFQSLGRRVDCFQFMPMLKDELIYSYRLIYTCYLISDVYIIC